MAVTVTNVSDMVLLIRLRSGRSVHLRPGARTGELAAAEVRHNPRVDPLAERRLVRIDDVPADPAAGSSESDESPETAESSEATEPAETAEPARNRRGRSGPRPKASEGSSG